MSTTNDQAVPEPAAQSGGEKAVEVEETRIEPDQAALLETLAAERDRLAAEKAELYDRLLRTKADFENLRRRSEREKAEIREFAAMSAVGALLPVVDDLQRALGVECADKEYVKGVELIWQRLTETLRKLGLDPIPAEGQKFDPHLHHAVETVETDEAGDHTILAELQTGYNFRGKLLRPAMVKVAVAANHRDRQ